MLYKQYVILKYFLNNKPTTMRLLIIKWAWPYRSMTINNVLIGELDKALQNNKKVVVLGDIYVDITKAQNTSDMKLELLTYLACKDIHMSP